MPRSGFEIEVLRNARESGLVVAYEPDSFAYSKTYTPDLRITLSSGRVFYVEAKGWFRPADRTKLKQVKESNPELDLRMLFQRDQRLSKHSKTTYSQWAATHKFPWAVGTTLPDSWLNDEDS